MAITKAAKEGIKKLDVFIDASTITFGLKKYKEAPNRMYSNPLRPAYVRIANTIAKARMEVNFYKIYSHIDIDGNEEADRLANEARRRDERDGQNRHRSGMTSTVTPKIHFFI